MAHGTPILSILRASPDAAAVTDRWKDTATDLQQRRAGWTRLWSWVNPVDPVHPCSMSSPLVARRDALCSYRHAPCAELHASIQEAEYTEPGAEHVRSAPPRGGRARAPAYVLDAMHLPRPRRVLCDLPRHDAVERRMAVGEGLSASRHVMRRKLGMTTGGRPY